MNNSGLVISDDNIQETLYEYIDTDENGNNIYSLLSEESFSVSDIINDDLIYIDPEPGDGIIESSTFSTNSVPSISWNTKKFLMLGSINIHIKMAVVQDVNILEPQTLNQPI